jgi:hypothetical protein
LGNTVNTGISPVIADRVGHRWYINAILNKATKRFRVIDIISETINIVDL